MTTTDDRTHGGVFPDVDRVEQVIRQMPAVGFGAHYVDAVRAARDALAALSSPPADDVREALHLPIASASDWGWDSCIVCGSGAVTDRALSLLLPKGVPTLVRLGWCDSTQECRDDLRQTKVLVLLPAEVEAVDAFEVRLRGTVTQTEEEVSRLEQIAGKVEVSRQTVTDAEVWCPHWSPGRITKRAGCSACYAGPRVSAENTTPTNHADGDS